MATLVMMHFPTNTGYALADLERTFHEVGLAVEGDPDKVHFSYSSLGGGAPTTLPEGFPRLTEYDFRTHDRQAGGRISSYVATHGIRRVLAFDLAPGHPVHRVLRGSGVERIVSYMGAPLGSIRSGPSLWIRKAKTLLQAKADVYVFESEAMLETGLFGWGVPAGSVKLVRMGVDTERFQPGLTCSEQVKQRFGVPASRKVVVYSGHFEERKGVAVIIRAARHLVEKVGYHGAHFLLCGNKGREAAPYEAMLEGTPTKDFVTFAGYRNDLHEVMSGADLGVIASTGWDSFTRSAMEMAACGVPLLASSLQGLQETVEEGATGHLFPPGDHTALAKRVRQLLCDDAKRGRMAVASRKMAIRRYSMARHIRELAATLRPPDPAPNYGPQGLRGP